MRTHNQDNFSLYIELDPRCILKNSQHDLIRFLDNVFTFSETYENVYFYSEKSLFSTKEILEHSLFSNISHTYTIQRTTENTDFLVITPYNFNTYLEALSSSHLNKISCHSIYNHGVDNPIDIQQGLKDLAVQIEFLIKKTSNSSLSCSNEKKYTNALSLYAFTKNYVPKLLKSTYPEVEYQRIFESLLLKVLSEISIIAYDEKDFVTGWIHIHQYEPTPIISTPFLYIDLRSEKSGTINEIAHLPSLLSLNSHMPSFSIIEAEEKPYKEPTVMLQSPDRFGIKFFTKLKGRLENFLLHKVYYFNSGLSYQGNTPCTQTTIEFWIEPLDEEGLFETINNTSLQLECFHTCECPPELFNLRFLTDMGGTTNEVYCVNNITEVKDNQIAGGLKGVRCIDSQNNRIMDYRFQKKLNSITIERVLISEHLTVCKFTYEIPLKSFFQFESSNSITFYIY